MKNKIQLTAILFLAVLTMFTIKPRYGGEGTIHLNEPDSFSFVTSNYSNIIFYSLIYENFYYLKKNGEIFTNIFKSYTYNKDQKLFILELNKNLSFSNGEPVSPENVKTSLKHFMELGTVYSKKFSRIVKKINLIREKIVIELLYDYPDIRILLTAPDLVLQSGSNRAFSGQFSPEEWIKGKHISFSANKYYPGGRSYLDTFKVIFEKNKFTDIFISIPHANFKGYNEYPAGIYQNVYIIFPSKNIGKNTKNSIYSLLKNFGKKEGLLDLNVLTSEEESPISLRIKLLAKRKIKRVLRHSNIELYLFTGLKRYRDKLNKYFAENGIKIKTIFLNSNQIENYLNNTDIKYLILEKFFQKRIPLEHKIKTILDEMLFKRYDESYLRMVNELEEIKLLKNEELLMNHIAKIITKVVNEGIVLPLFQERYSIYFKNNISGIEIDYYGRPLFQNLSKEHSVLINEK